MDLARPKRAKTGHREPQISSECLRELENLLQEADVGENYQMDTALHEACRPVADVACRDVTPGEARVLNCLMEKVLSNIMCTMSQYTN